MRRTVLHFVCIGALGFALAGSRPPARPLPPPSPSDAPDDDALYRAGLALQLDRDDAVVQSRLLRNMRFLDGETDRESLYREALDLGIDRGDAVVRRRVVERMRARLRAPALAAEPSEADLEAYLAAHRDAFRIPPRAAFVQIFFNAQRRGARAEADARAMLARLGPADIARAEALGDPLPVAPATAPLCERDVARVLGAELAARVLALPPGRWSGPIASPYGLHLVWVTERIAAVDPSLATVRGQVRAAVREAGAEAALRESLAALRAGDAAAPDGAD